MKLANIIIFIIGIGKRTIGDAICKLDPSFKNVTPDDWMTPILRLLGDDDSTLYTLTLVAFIKSLAWLCLNYHYDQ